MIALVVALLVATPEARDARYEIAVKQLKTFSFSLRAAGVDACTLRAADRSLQWFLSEGGSTSPAGPAVFLPNAALREPSRVDVVAAGDYVLAVVRGRNSGALLAKVAGKCARGAGDVAPPQRSLDTCAPWKERGEPAYFSGVVDTSDGLYVLEPEESRVRLDLAAANRLACAGTPATDVRSDLPWKHEDIAFLEARRAFTPTSPVDTTSYMSPEMVEAALRALAAAHPTATRLETIATTHQGRPVLALAVGEDLADDDHRPTLLLNGGHHGDELLSTNVVIDAAKALLEDGRLHDIHRTVVVWCVPLVNPDGLTMFLDVSVRAGRKNGRDADNDGGRGIHDGVDLNRNYPFAWRATVSSGADGDKPLARMYPGPTAGSEPETRGMMALAEREHFVGAVSYHMGTVALLAPYTVSSAVDPAPNEAVAIADDVARKLGVHPEGLSMPTKKQLYEVDGTDQDWHRSRNGTVALIAEIASWPPSQDPARRRALLSFSRGIWVQLARRFIAGPSLVVRLLNAGGAPMEAAMTVDGQVVGNNERWTTRARDGVAARYVTKRGRHTVVLESDGKRIERSVTTGKVNEIAWPKD